MIKRPFFNENGKFIKSKEPVYLGGYVHGGTPKFHAKDRSEVPDSVSVLDNKDSSIAKMLKDKKMVQMIRDGKGSDKGIKREAFAIEKENSRKPKEKWLTKKKANLKRMYKEFKLGPYARKEN